MWTLVGDYLKNMNNVNSRGFEPLILLKLDKVIELLSNASAVIVGDHAVVFPDVEGATGDDSFVFLKLAWESEGADYAIEFEEGTNREVTASGSSLFLVGTSGEEEQLSILMPCSIASLTNV